MNEDRKKKARQKHCKRYNEAQMKKLERELSRMRREEEKKINKDTHFVRPTSTSEHDRIAISRLPKVKQEIEDVRAYRKERAKRRKK